MSSILDYIFNKQAGWNKRAGGQKFFNQYLTKTTWGAKKVHEKMRAGGGAKFEKNIKQG